MTTMEDKESQEPDEGVEDMDTSDDEAVEEISNPTLASQRETSRRIHRQPLNSLLSHRPESLAWKLRVLL